VERVVRPLIVGEAPGAGDGPVLAGRCGEKLAEFAGVGSYAELAARFDLRNLLDVRAEREGRGDFFPPSAALQAADVLRACLSKDDRVVLLGGRVARAFGVARYGFFRWYDLDSARAVTIPHPSGVNRLYNDEIVRERAAKALRPLSRRSR
jgi:uracil-DNA glycosylase